MSNFTGHPQPPAPFTLTLSPAGQASITNAFWPGASLLLWLTLSSLFSWARDEQRKLYGWWGASLKDRDHTFGSFLWRLERAKLTDKTVADAKAYLDEALAWMVRDSVVDSVDVETGRDGSRLWATIVFLRGVERERLDFADLWRVLLGP